MDKDRQSEFVENKKLAQKRQQLVDVKDKITKDSL